MHVNPSEKNPLKDQLKGDEGPPRNCSTRSLEKRQIHQQVLKLLVQGVSKEEICRIVGFQHQMSVYRVIWKEMARLDRYNAKKVQQLKELEDRRLDEYVRRIWPQLTGKHEDGTPYKYGRNEATVIARAIEVAIKISERRAKLWGLDEPEVTKTLTANVDLQTLTTLELRAEAERLGLTLRTPDSLPKLLPGEVIDVVPEPPQ